MEAKVVARDKAKVVVVSGEIVLMSSPRLRDVLKDLTGKKEPRIVVDLKDVPYIDSSGLATLVECYRETKRYKGVLRLAQLATNVREVFRMARLDTVFEIFASTEEALAA
ncbi:MAG: STAS domain-containing protein [Planctomycetes bacterium]|nr:STAS domain-containing protein [Planctomycetota bacterium]